jgi:hypothetical protein
MTSGSRRLTLCGAAAAMGARAAHHVEGDGRTCAGCEAEQNATSSDNAFDTVLDAMATIMP